MCYISRPKPEEPEGVGLCGLGALVILLLIIGIVGFIWWWVSAD